MLRALLLLGFLAFVEKPWTTGEETAACKLDNPDDVFNDIRSRFNESDLTRIHHYLGRMPHVFSAAQAGRTNFTIEWGEQHLWDPDFEESSLGAVLFQCGACNPRRGRTSGGVEYLSDGGTTVNRIKMCSYLTARELRETLSGAVGSLDSGYACVADIPIIVHYGRGGCVDDTIGLHMVPTLTKNRPIVKSAYTIGNITVRENGVLLPLQFDRHFEDSLKVFKRQRKDRTEIQFEDKIDALVWRGGTQGSEEPGIAEIQRCVNSTSAKSSKYLHSFRGAPGTSFVPGLPWECRQKNNLSMSESCRTFADILPKQASRLELVQRWGNVNHTRTNKIMRHEISYVNSSIDVGFYVQPADFDDVVKVLLTACDIDSQRTSLTFDNQLMQDTMLEYRYIMSVEGADKATNLQWILASTSIPVMPPPSIETWLLESRLQPWVHYAPVRPDFADVLDVINVLRRNKTLALSIAEAGQVYMLQFGTHRHEKKVASAVVRLYASILSAARESAVQFREGNRIEGS